MTSEVELITKLIRLEIQRNDEIKDLEKRRLDLMVHKLELESARDYKKRYGEEYLPLHPTAGVFYFWDEQIYNRIVDQIDKINLRIEELKI